MRRFFGGLGALIVTLVMATGCVPSRMPSDAAGPVAYFSEVGVVGQGQVVVALNGMEVDPSTVWMATETGFRHRQSGMECTPDLSLNGLVLHSLAIYEKNGNQAACRYKDEARPVAVTFYLIHAPGATAEEHMKEATAKVQRRYPRAGPAFVKPPEMRDGLGQPMEAAANALYTDEEGVPQKTSILIVRRGDWHINAQGTYPDDKTAPTIEAKIAERARDMALQVGR